MQIRDEALASEGNWSVVPRDNNIPSETEEEEALEERWRQDEEKRRQVLDGGAIFDACDYLGLFCLDNLVGDQR